MKKTILITGASDGIGLATSKMLLAQGHHILLHGRSADKLERIADDLSEYKDNIELYLADLSDLSQVKALANNVRENHDSIDVLINNAGVLKTPKTTTAEGLDIRFVVNTLAPYLLTKELLPLLDNGNSRGRIVNLSSAAQETVDLEGLKGQKQYTEDMPAYAQSKLAITMWSRALAEQLGDEGPMVVAVNPASLLGSKMVKEGFGVAGGDINIGADILTRAALSGEFANASGQYFDNDSKRFSDPHIDALDSKKVTEVMHTIETLLMQ